MAYAILDPHLISIEFRIRIENNQPIAHVIREISPKVRSEKQPFALYCRFSEGVPTINICTSNIPITPS